MKYRIVKVLDPPRYSHVNAIPYWVVEYRFMGMWRECPRYMSTEGNMISNYSISCSCAEVWIQEMTKARNYWLVVDNPTRTVVKYLETYL